MTEGISSLEDLTARTALTEHEQTQEPSRHQAAQSYVVCAMGDERREETMAWAATVRENTEVLDLVNIYQVSTMSQILK